MPHHYFETKCAAEIPPLISIVTPSYNQAEFLEQTIASVIKQDYPRLEHIVQDGGSTDDTAEILEKYRLQFSNVESSRDKGQANAINLGFGHATGEIMAWLNSDDLLLPGALNYVANYFSRQPEIDVVYGHRILVDDNDQEIGRWVLPPHNRRILFWADYVPQESLFWRRRMWERVGGHVDETYQFAIDWELLLRFQEVGAKMSRLPRFLGAFRVHETQKTSTQLNQLGSAEMDRLRKRYHGRSISQAELGRHIGPYLTRSLMEHGLYRLGILRY